MKNKVQTITFENQYLSSRENAAHKRVVVLSYLEEGSDIIFDLTNVKSISASYADELFAILYLSVRSDFKERITFLVDKSATSNDNIRSISDAIKMRESQENDRLVYS
ncbi:STAS-like domain-containing protein [Leptospira bandrabouensis]|uniref:STAS-like domain-containing protein n=1 Tax=Leptospira bandrabouensis TaxID=2484903 RepID=UPI0010916EE2|nr:DUF4325 domain-containing protein [Leptospira bandrabouensis]TGN08610.1 hypothetical protein EHR07_03580 [Leptospira bandrabouensis]